MEMSASYEYAELVKYRSTLPNMLPRLEIKTRVQFRPLAKLSSDPMDMVAALNDGYNSVTTRGEDRWR